MSKKLSEFKEKDKEKLITEINKRASILGLESWYTDSPRSVVRGSEFGICQSCTNLQVTRSKYAVKSLRCETNDRLILSENDPVVECSNYSRRGELNLNAMFSIAIIIEPAKEKAGF